MSACFHAGVVAVSGSCCCCAVISSLEPEVERSAPDGEGVVRGGGVVRVATDGDGVARSGAPDGDGAEDSHGDAAVLPAEDISESDEPASASVTEMIN